MRAAWLTDNLMVRQLLLITAHELQTSKLTFENVIAKLVRQKDCVRSVFFRGDSCSTGAISCVRSVFFRGFCSTCCRCHGSSSKSQTQCQFAGR